jgi:hypothetical protein
MRHFSQKAVPHARRHLLINFLLFKVEFCFGKVQNTIIPLQNLLESNFLVRFENTSPAS